MQYEQLKNDIFNYQYKGIHIWYLILSTLFYYSAVYAGSETLHYTLYYVIPIIYIVFHYRQAMDLCRICFRNQLKYYIFALVILGIGSIALPLIYGTNDYSYFTIRIIQIGKESVKIIFLLMLYMRHISMNCDVKLFMKYFVLATCLYVLGSCVIICIPGLRDLFLALNKADANTIRLAHKSTYITRFGWCGFSGFTFTLKCSLAAIMMCYIIYQEKLQHFYFNSSLLFICILGNLFYGRIGLVVSGVYFVTLFAMLWKKKEKEMCLRFMRMVCIGTMILALMAVISPKVRSWLYWAFQSFINLLCTGNFETTSAMSLKKMYFIPEIKTFLIGDGKYTLSNGDYYMGTDVGLLRPLLFGGILFQLLRYSTVFVLILQMKEYGKKEQMWMLCSLVFFFLVFEIKGEVIFPVISVLFAIALLLSCHQEVDETR